LADLVIGFLRGEAAAEAVSNALGLPSPAEEDSHLDLPPPMFPGEAPTAEIHYFVYGLVVYEDQALAGKRIDVVHLFFRKL
jgi:hypothetical protein